jgi:hypothetical protein
MSDHAVQRVLKLYASRGTIELIVGDTNHTARAWLEQAADDFDGVRALLGQERWRLAYKGGYDVLRNAARRSSRSRVTGSVVATVRTRLCSCLPMRWWRGRATSSTRRTWVRPVNGYVA